MDLNNIKRNQLDYILTDILPAELSELFTYKYFYEFMLTQNKKVDDMINKMILMKNNSSWNSIPFNGSINWVTVPLKYTIMKTLNSEREISLIQPLAAIEVLLFVSTYEKEILNVLSKNSVYSIRYHNRNNDLYYKHKNRAIIKYFNQESKNIKKSVIQQTGMYFDIKPYKSIKEFTSSEDWFVINSKYKYFIRTDYKACFDSIYTHTYKWLLGKDVNDTANFNNVNMYTVIDRIMQNINARTSNGIVVGPEFSRMIAEILLQGIDTIVYNTLLNKGYKNGVEYNTYRYVDDIFIFAESEELADEIVKIFAEAARKYLLRLNDSKLYRSKVPFILDNWLNETNIFVNRVSNVLFNSKEQQKEIVEKIRNKNENKDKFENNNEDVKSEIKAYIFRDDMLNLMKSSIMKQFNKLVCDYEDKNRTVVAYFMGMILNKVQRNKEKVNIFREKVLSKTIYDFLDFIFYVYSFYPDYNNTQRLLSIISYVRDEFDLFEEHEILQKLINKYAFVFDKSNINDIINFILFCRQAEVEIPYIQECNILDKLREKDDPILWASYLLYSEYSEKYFEKVKDEIFHILEEKMEAIVCKNNIYTYREFWWMLIFNKSPYIDSKYQIIFDNIIIDLKTRHSTVAQRNPGEICGELFVEFLETQPKQFFGWDMKNRDFLREVTFKTYERSIFKNYKENTNFMDWSSII